MAGETTVGSIIGFLRLDADQFHREVERAIAETDVLDGKRVDVKVKASTHDAETGLARVAAEAEKVDRSAVKMNRSFDGGGGMMSPQVVIGGITAAMALLGPVTGAATAAMGGFVGVAGTAVLAYRGFQQEVQKGTALGQYLQGSLKDIKGEFDSLGTTAARAMQGDVLSGLSEIRRFLPTLNPEVESLAGHLGRAFNTSAKGVVSGLQNMMPLLQDGGKYAEVLANKFASFTASQEFKNFVAYAQRELPNVGSALMSLTQGIVSLGVALAPVGDDLVELIRVSGEAATAVAPLVHILAQLSTAPGSGLGMIGEVGKETDHFRQAVMAASPAGFLLTQILHGNATAATSAKDAIGEHTSYLLSLQAVQSPLASALGTTAQALQTATTAQKQQADSAAAALVQMQLENDAAGILRGTLDQLNGKALSAADAQNAFDSSLANMGTHVTATGKEIHFTTANINNMSAASVALRGQLNGQVANLQRVVEANGGLANSTGKARETMVKMRQQIIDNAVAHGVDRAAVTAYIDKLLAIPKKVPPTKLDVDNAAALTKIQSLKSALAGLHDRTLSVTVNEQRFVNSGPSAGGGRNTSGGSTKGSANGNIFHAFAGGGFENHVAQIAPAGAMRLWAEPETGGEAYIPLAPSKRARSTAILAETNRLMGDPLGGRGGDIYNVYTNDPLAAAHAVRRRQEFERMSR